MRVYCNKKFSDAANSKEKEKAPESAAGGNASMSEGIEFLADEIQEQGEESEKKGLAED